LPNSPARHQKKKLTRTLSIKTQEEATLALSFSSVHSLLFSLKKQHDGRRSLARRAEPQPAGAPVRAMEEKKRKRREEEHQ
jgi:hypothetical protein